MWFDCVRQVLTTCIKLLIALLTIILCGAFAQHTRLAKAAALRGPGDQQIAIHMRPLAGFFRDPPDVVLKSYTTLSSIFRSKKVRRNTRDTGRAEYLLSKQVLSKKF